MSKKTMHRVDAMDALEHRIIIMVENMNALGPAFTDHEEMMTWVSYLSGLSHAAQALSTLDIANTERVREYGSRPERSADEPGDRETH